MIDNQRISPNLCQNRGNQQARKANQAGFTLIEVLVAFAILGILLSMAGGSWWTLRSDEQVRSAAGKVYSAMTAARIKALGTGQPQCVGIDHGLDRISTSIWEKEGQPRFCDFSGATVVANPAASIVWEDTEGVNLNSYAIGSSTIATAEANLVRWYKFSPRGTATSNSVLVQSTVLTIPLAIALTVNGVTGRVRMTDLTINQ